MLYKFKDGQIITGVFSFDEIEDALDLFKIDRENFVDFVSTKTNNFESNEDYDLISINIIHINLMELLKEQAIIYLGESQLFVFCESKDVREAICKYFEEQQGELTLDIMLYHILRRLAGEGPDIILGIEKKISKLEEKILTGKPVNCTGDIITMRKKLLILKRYYTQFYDLLEGIQENENNLIHEETLKYFKIFRSKIDRLVTHISAAGDYITQVREAYQAQIDIELNEIMKFFTVITSVFLPLNLIVGWYGMNLDLPEYQFPYIYPAVVGMCVLVVSGCLLYFKKHGWF